MDKQTYISWVPELRCKAVTTAASMLADQAEAEDVAQEVLLRMWDKVNTLDEDNARVMAYASTTAKNIAQNHLRSKRRHPFLRLLRKSKNDEEEPIEISTHLTPHRQMELQETNEIFVRALEGLPYNWQRVLQMRNVEDLTFEEIARVMGTTESSVRGILCKARQRMMELIKQQTR